MRMLNVVGNEIAQMMIVLESDRRQLLAFVVDEKCPVVLSQNVHETNKHGQAIEAAMFANDPTMNVAMSRLNFVQIEVMFDRIDEDKRLMIDG